MQSFSNLLFIIPSFLLALSIHEAAHAAMAYYLGDPTAKSQGRLTLNPIKHLDLAGTLLLFFVGFGWGKPVPVDSRYFKNRKLDNALVSLAGPLSNILLALVSILLLKHIVLLPFFIIKFLKILVSINLILSVFNLLPIPPLDGSHIWELVIPNFLQPYWEKFQENAPFLLLAVLLAERQFNLGFITKLLFFLTDWLYVFLYSIS